MAVRAQATVTAALAAVVEALQEINASRDTVWLTTPKTCRRVSNPSADLAAPRPAILVKCTQADPGDTHLAVNRDAVLRIEVGGLAQDAAGADEVIWNLEADVRRVLLLEPTLGGMFEGALDWKGTRTEDVGAGGSGEAMTVATFEGLVFWTADNP